MAGPQADETPPKKPLRPASHTAGGIDGGGGGEEEAKAVFSWLPLVGFAFLVHNTATVVCGSSRSAWALGAANVDSACLFWCVSRRFGRRSKENLRLKTAVWVLAMTLTTVLSYAVAEAHAEVPAMGPGFKMKQLGRKFLLPKVLI